METVVQAPPEDLNLLTNWGDPDEPARRRRAALGTGVVHVLGIAIILAMPRSWFAPPPPEVPRERHITPIYMPLTPLTQRAPNPEKAPKQFSDVDSAKQARQRSSPPPAPPVRAPQTAPAPAPQPVRQATLPQPPTVKPPQPTQTPEPPQIDTPGRTAKLDLPQDGIPLPTLPPRTQASRTPLENLGGPAPVVPPDQRKIQMPDTSVQGALHPTPSPAISGVGQAPQESLPQLLSDAQGVDFTPYLRIILQIVRRNWNANMPASVKMGGRGNTSLVFSIERMGTIGKLVIVKPSGTEVYDQAAVAGVSASQPFPPLPSQFKGNEIRVQFNFAYNAPKQ
jgi:TonB family protein